MRYPLSCLTGVRSRKATSVFYYFLEALYRSFALRNKQNSFNGLITPFRLDPSIAKYSEFIRSSFDDHQRAHNFTFFVASSDSPLVRTSSPNLVRNEIYRFISHPLYSLPILSLYIYEVSSIIFPHFPHLFLSNVHLRLSRAVTPDTSSHTLGFHRDTNGNQTFKCFVNLTTNTDPFLEYISSTSLTNIASASFFPAHISRNELLNSHLDLIDSNFMYTSTDQLTCDFLQTNCIHREFPSDRERLTLILTFLPHRDFGLSSFRLSKSSHIHLSQHPYSHNILRFGVIK